MLLGAKRRSRVRDVSSVRDHLDKDFGRKRGTGRQDTGRHTGRQSTSRQAPASPRHTHRDEDIAIGKKSPRFDTAEGVDITAQTAPNANDGTAPATLARPPVRPSRPLARPHSRRRLPPCPGVHAVLASATPPSPLRPLPHQCFPPVPRSPPHRLLARPGRQLARPQHLLARPHHLRPTRSRPGP